MQKSALNRKHLYKIFSRRLKISSCFYFSAETTQFREIDFIFYAKINLTFIKYETFICVRTSKDIELILIITKDFICGMDSGKRKVSACLCNVSFVIYLMSNNQKVYLLKRNLFGFYSIYLLGIFTTL